VQQNSTFLKPRRRGTGI